MSNHMRDLVAAATAWLVRIESPSCTPEQRRTFQEWLAADVRHRAAVAIASGITTTKPALKSRHRRLFAFVAAGAACICAAGWYASSQLTWQDYSTHIGGKQTSPLADGSSVTLNTDTDLRVRITAGRRDLALTRGEAIIKAAHDDRRPVRLVVGSTVIRTAGADFDVRKRAGGQVDVLVSDGRVATETDESWLSLDHSAHQRGIVSAGYMASIRPGDTEVSRLDLGELARRTAWVRDVLDFHGETLAEAAEDFNRYNTRKIVIDDPKIATRRVGGVFLDTDPDSFVAALALTMDIRATTGEKGPGYGIIRLRSAQARR
jgi:transmembrane sensor